MRTLIYLSLSAIFIISVGLNFHGRVDADVVPPVRSPNLKQTYTQADQTNSGLVGSGFSKLSSPFGRGEPPDLGSMEERIKYRKARMRGLGLATPESYDLMGFSELEQRAKANDVFAMLQLGQQLMFENDFLERDPGYDFKKDPGEEAVKAFSGAMASGHVHSAAVLAAQYWAQGNVVDALAWNILAERLGDTTGSEWSANAFNEISNEDRSSANLKADNLFSLAVKRFDSQ